MHCLSNTVPPVGFSICNSQWPIFHLQLPLGFGDPAVNWAALLFGVMIAFTGSPHRLDAGQPRGPNIVLIMADDMGHGDLGFHGNPIIKTPHLDRVARQSVRMKYFYVSPVARRRGRACSPGATITAPGWLTRFLGDR